MIRAIRLSGRWIPVMTKGFRDPTNDGEYCPRDATIHINPDIEGEAAYRVLLHELCHAWLHASGNNYLIGDEDKEEAFCESFAMTFSQLFHLLPTEVRLVRQRKKGSP